MTEPTEIVEDARGLLCPLPVIRLAERLRSLPRGASILLLADDPAAEEDVRLWARGQGQEVLETAWEGGIVRIRVRRLR